MAAILRAMLSQPLARAAFAALIAGFAGLLLGAEAERRAVRWRSDWLTHARWVGLADCAETVGLLSLLASGVLLGLAALMP